MRYVLTAAFGLIVVGAALAYSVPARAGDDDVPIDTRIFRGILKGIGLQSPGDQNEIKYQEQPPLVIPPNDNLPPPQKPGAAIAKDPAWPKDPDVARRKLEKQQENHVETTQEIISESYPLRPNEIAPGRKPGKQLPRSAAQADNTTTNRPGGLLSAVGLGYKGGLFSNMFGGKDDNSAVAKFTGEPARTSLTDPPPGYQTPSPDQPYGQGEEASPPKPTNYYITHGEDQSVRH